MITHNFKTTFNLGPIKAGEENEAFAWVRRSSPIAKYITALEFSYRNGFTVECCLPHDIGPHQMGTLYFESYKLFQSRPWSKCSPAE